MALVKAGPKLGIVGSKALEELQYEVGFPHLARLVHLVKFIMDGAELVAKSLTSLHLASVRLSHLFMRSWKPEDPLGR